jgi:hypothetical protein
MPKPSAGSRGRDVIADPAAPLFSDVAGRLTNFELGIGGTSMLNRLTVSALLKTVIAITSVCVVIALSLTAYESWDRLQTANRISGIANASADLFKAMHNLRTDRSTTTRLLNATEPVDSEIDKYLRALRDAQMPAMARALELLPNIDFPQSGTLVPELARLYKLLTEEQKQFWEDVAKPKDQRRANLA